MTSVNEMNAYLRGKKRENKRVKKILLEKKLYYLKKNESARAKLVQWIIDEI